MKMAIGKTYRITKKIKIHTSPLAEVEVVKEGLFMKETAQSYIFDDFRVNKFVVIKIEELEGDTI